MLNASAATQSSQNSVVGAMAAAMSNARIEGLPNIDTGRMAQIDTAGSTATTPKLPPRISQQIQHERLREAAPGKDILRFYEPVEFNLEVRRAAGDPTYTELLKFSPAQLRQSIDTAQECENQRIAFQSALMCKFMDDGVMPMSELNFTKVGLNEDKVSDYERAALLLSNNSKFQVSVDNGRYETRSGLKVRPAMNWNYMSLEKHQLMRVSPIFKFAHHGEKIKGKIYADYLDINNPKSRAVVAMAEKGDNADFSSINQDALKDIDAVQHQMHFNGQPNLFQHAFNTLISEAMLAEPQQARLGDIAPATAGEPRLNGAVRPSIVEWADDTMTDNYITKVRFDQDGAFELVLPKTVVDQYEGQIPEGATKADGKPHLLVFVQDLEGNVKTTRHKDTHYHHSTPNGGKPVRTAGELFGHFSVKNSGLKNQEVVFHVDKVCNKSGHYWPKVETMATFRDDLIASGLNPTKLKFEAVTNDKDLKAVVSQWSQSNAPSTLPNNHVKANSFRGMVEKYVEALSQPKPRWIIPQ